MISQQRFRHNTRCRRSSHFVFSQHHTERVLHSVTRNRKRFVPLCTARARVALDRVRLALAQRRRQLHVHRHRRLLGQVPHRQHFHANRLVLATRRCNRRAHRLFVFGWCDCSISSLFALLSALCSLLSAFACRRLSVQLGRIRHPVQRMVTRLIGKRQTQRESDVRGRRFASHMRMHVPPNCAPTCCRRAAPAQCRDPGGASRAARCVPWPTATQSQPDCSRVGATRTRPAHCRPLRHASDTATVIGQHYPSFNNRARLTHAEETTVDGPVARERQRLAIQTHHFARVRRKAHCTRTQPQLSTTATKPRCRAQTSLKSLSRSLAPAAAALRPCPSSCQCRGSASTSTAT
jgi:hypothetical protein